MGFGAGNQQCFDHHCYSKKKKKVDLVVNLPESPAPLVSLILLLSEVLLLSLS